MNAVGRSLLDRVGAGARFGAGNRSPGRRRRRRSDAVARGSHPSSWRAWPAWRAWRVWSARGRAHRIVPAAVVVAVVVVIGAGLAGSALWWAPALRVAEVRIVGAPSGTGAEILAAAAVPKGEPLVEVDTEAVAGRVSATGRFLAVDTRRGWPDAVVVTVTPREAVVAVGVGTGTDVVLLDADGNAFRRVSAAPAGVPRATVSPVDGGAERGGVPGAERGAEQAERGAERIGSDAVRRSLATVAAGWPARLRAKVSSVEVDTHGRVTFRIGAVRVAWGRPDSGALKAAVVEALVARPGVAFIDVTAPTEPATRSDTRPA